MFNKPEYGLTVLRLGLAVVLLWFGFSQLFDATAWTGWVPEWTESMLGLSPAMVVLLNGAFEVTAGTLLAVNVLVRPVAALVALHFALVTYEIGFTAIGVRDFGLTAAALALVFLSPSKHTYKSSAAESDV